jgi:hypothetical protein
VCVLLINNAIPVIFVEKKGSIHERNALRVLGKGIGIRCVELNDECFNGA